MNKDYPMLTVVVVALTLMMAVQIFGIYFDALFKDPRIETVECSADIHNMARKLNVTLLGSCEVVR